MFQDGRNPNGVIAGGRFYVGADDGFTPEQYADMALTRMFESAKDWPQPMKTQALEQKFRVRKILTHFFAEAMADERRRVGIEFEAGRLAKAVDLLPVDLTAAPHV